jgi:hypothetical protein
MGRHKKQAYIVSETVELLSEIWADAKADLSGLPDFEGKTEDNLHSLGKVVYDLGRHVFATAAAEPWEGGRSIGPSIHLCNAWLWICATGWNHFHDLDLTGDTIAYAARANRSVWINHLTKFNVFVGPPAILKRFCDYYECENQFVPSRSDARFCSAKCRVGGFRYERNYKATAVARHKARLEKKREESRQVRELFHKLK